MPMKKISISILSLLFALSVNATRHVVNQIPVSGNVLNLNISVGDTVDFNLSHVLSVRQVNESTWNSSGSNGMPGGFSIAGSGQVLVGSPGTHFFVIVFPNGNTVKGSIVANTVTSRSNLVIQENPIESKIINERLLVQVKTSSNSGTIKVHDLLGNKIIETTANDGLDISMAGHKAGVYFIIWKDGKNSFTKKFIYRPEN
jgi:hypothetical protein